MADPPTKVRWKVAAITGTNRDTCKVAPWCIPLPEGSTVADLTRAVTSRENNRRKDAGGPSVAVDIQLDFEGSLCAVSPHELLLDLAPRDSKDAMFVAVCKEGRSAVTPPPSPPEVSPAVPAAAAAAAAAAPTTAAAPTAARPASPSSTQDVHQSVAPKSSVDAAAAGKPKSSGGGSSSGGSSSGSRSSSISRYCGACSGVFTASAVTFSCRMCGKLFHRDCVGYNRNYTCNNFPPPDWICPRCPNGERGPLERCVHPSLKGKGIATQHGNMPWCPICLDDNREPGKTNAGAKMKNKCRGCGLHTHARCLAKLEIESDGRWPCHECQRRRDGVVPGNNPTWLRLKAARSDGDYKKTSAPRPPSGNANTSAAAAASVDGTGSPNSERMMPSIDSASSSADTTSAATTSAAGSTGVDAPGRAEALARGPGGGGAAAKGTPVVPPFPLARSASSPPAQISSFSAPSPASKSSPTALPSFRRLQAGQGLSASERDSRSAGSGGKAKGKAKAEFKEVEDEDEDDGGVECLGDSHDDKVAAAFSFPPRKKARVAASSSRRAQGSPASSPSQSSASTAAKSTEAGHVNHEDTEGDVVWLGDSNGNRAAVSSSPPLSSCGPVAHRTLVAPPSSAAGPNVDQDLQPRSGNAARGARRIPELVLLSKIPELVPRSCVKSPAKAAQNIILAAAMAHGTRVQQEACRTFAMELVKHQEYADSLFARLKATAGVSDKAVWVNQSKLIGLFRTIQASNSSYQCLTRYVLGDAKYPKNAELVDEGVIRQAFNAVTSSLRRKSPSYNKELEPWYDSKSYVRFFRWNGTPIAE